MNLLGLEIPLEEMTGSQKRIADFISKNNTRLAYLTEKEIAEELDISTATVSRFWRTIGFGNIKQFKDHLKKKMVTTPSNKLEDILNKTGREALHQEMFQLASATLCENATYISADKFEKAIAALSQARQIYLYGPGPNEALTALIHFRLNRLGLNVHVMPKSGPEIFESLVNVSEGDAIVIFGFGHVLRETRVILDAAAKRKAVTILITDFRVSEIVEMSDIDFYISRGELWEFHSLVVPLVLAESLIVGISRQNSEKYLTKLNDLHQLRKDYESSIPRY